MTDPAVGRSTTAAVSLSDVTKEFGRVRAVDGVSLDVAQGEFVALVGPTGCGKSTILEMIAGLIEPTQGVIRVGGRPVTGPGRDRAIVFQAYALFPWQTALENVAFPLRAMRVPRAERLEQAADLLARVGLERFADHHPHQLSGGMRQRVAIARALVTAPKALLMDEPFGALDALTRELMQQELLRVLAASRPTVVFVTHSLDEALYLSDRVIVMSRHPGRIKADVRVPERTRGETGATARTLSPEMRAMEERLRSLLYEEVAEPHLRSSIDSRAPVDRLEREGAG
jgi:NitT/TauT family transport system ATP-binding protein